MEAGILLKNLNREGFHLVAESGRLLVAPASRLTREQADSIRACKAELLALLTGPTLQTTGEAIGDYWRRIEALPGRDKPNTPDEVSRLIQESSLLALDLETTGLDPRKAKVRLLTLCSRYSVTLDCFDHDPRPLVQLLRGKILLVHNASFDLGFLWHLGLKDLPDTICTYLMAQVLTAGEGSHGFPTLNLGACCQRFLNLPLDKTLQQSSFAGTLTPEQIVYARKDAEVLIPLMMSLGRQITNHGLTRACEVEMQALPAFVWLSQSGVPFDRPAWKALADQAATESASLVQQLDAQAPKRSGEFFASWNWGSPPQVKEVLGLLGYDIDTSCDAQLALIAHPFADLLRRHRSASKRLTTYGHDWLDHVAADGRVYPNWRQLGAASGRTSCQTPNMQQIPRGTDYRKCVRAGEGKTLIKSDYATLQMRIAAKFSKDPALVQIFQAGADPHTETAKSTLGKSTITKEDRQIAKSQNFGLLFAMSAKGLQIYAKTTYGVDFTEQEAEKHRATFFKTYPGLARWHAETKRLHCRETRGTTGRRRLLPVNASDTWRLNSPVQADEADGLKSSLGLLWKRRADCPSAYPVLAIHDEIVIEVVESEAEQAKAWLEAAMMDGMAPLLDPVPCLVESTVKKTWGG